MMKIPSRGAPIHGATGEAQSGPVAPAPASADAETQPRTDPRTAAWQPAATRSPLAIAPSHGRPGATDRSPDQAGLRPAKGNGANHQRRGDKVVQQAYFTPRQLEACRRAVAEAASGGDGSAREDAVNATFRQWARDLELADVSPLRACIDPGGQWTRLGQVLWTTRASTDQTCFYNDILDGGEWQAIAVTKAELFDQGYRLKNETIARLFGKAPESITKKINKFGQLSSRGQAQAARAGRAYEPVTDDILSQAHALKQRGAGSQDMVAFATAAGVSLDTLKKRLAHWDPARAVTAVGEPVDLFSSAIRQRAAWASRTALSLPTPASVWAAVDALAGLAPARAGSPSGTAPAPRPADVLLSVAHQHRVDPDLLRGLVMDDGGLTEFGELMMTHVHPDTRLNTFMKFSLDDAARQVVSHAMTRTDAYAMPSNHRFRDVLAMFGGSMYNMGSYFLANGALKHGLPAGMPKKAARQPINQQLIEEAKAIVTAYQASGAPPKTKIELLTPLAIRHQLDPRRLATSLSQRNLWARTKQGQGGVRLPDIAPTTMAASTSAQATMGRQARAGSGSASWALPQSGKHGPGATGAATEAEPMQQIKRRRPAGASSAGLPAIDPVDTISEAAAPATILPGDRRPR